MRHTSPPVALCGCFMFALALGCSGTTTGGDQGTAGSSGTAGTNGTAGTMGDAGSNGTAGTSGTGNSGPGVGGNGTGGSSTGTAGSTGGSATGTAGTVGTGGNTGSGGRGGASGTAGRGGNSGTAGTVGTGGSVGTAGNTGTGGSGSCTIAATTTMSTKIPTVGITTFTTTMTGVTSASIDFGLTTSYGMTAPVDLTQASYRTLLLGMKAAKTYHYRVTVNGSGGSCQSQDYTLTTGALLAGLMKPTVTPTTAGTSGLYGGFLITGQYQGTPTVAYILDADGDFVWWFSIGGDVTGARMDYAGTHMWINSANVPSGTTRVHRVTMDGMTDENLSSQFTGLNHQLTVLPDETVAFYAYNNSAGCDDIKERAPNGTVKTIVNSGTALGVGSGCHCNNVQYSKDDNTLVFSDLDHVMVAKVNRTDGSTVWTLNDTSSSKNLTGATWTGGEHGLHLIDLTHILIFNNNSVGTMTSKAIELQLDTAGKKAMQTWSYDGGIANMIMGDVQRLPNGNTIVAYSTKGVLHEVSSSGTKLQTWTWTQVGQTIGYIEKRATLYGPPPK
jgi:hypothetical protein